MDEELEIPRGEPAIISPRQVHQTYFFRHLQDKERERAFNVFIDELAEKARQGEKIRVLSAGCSTGEEAYTIAIALLEKKVPPENIQIVGVDSDDVCISTAEDGIYDNIAFRDLAVRKMRSKYFTRGRYNEWKVKRAVKDLVTFRVCDLTKRKEMARLGKFDGAACTKVICYMPTGEHYRNNQRGMAYRNIARALYVGGTLLTDADNDRRLFVRVKRAKTGFKVHISEKELEKLTFNRRSLQRLNGQKFIFNSCTYILEFDPRQIGNYVTISVKRAEDDLIVAEFYLLDIANMYNEIDLCWKVLDNGLSEIGVIAEALKKFCAIMPFNHSIIHQVLPEEDIARLHAFLKKPGRPIPIDYRLKKWIDAPSEIYPLFSQIGLKISVQYRRYESGKEYWVKGTKTAESAQLPPTAGVSGAGSRDAFKTKPGTVPNLDLRLSLEQI